MLRFLAFIYFNQYSVSGGVERERKREREREREREKER